MQITDSPQEAECPDSNPDLTSLTQELLGMVPNALSSHVRTFLVRVLNFNDGSVQEAVRWLNSPVKALGNTMPIELIRKGDMPALQDFWRECEVRYGY